MKKRLIFCMLFAAILPVTLFFVWTSENNDARFVTFTADPKEKKIQLYWKDDTGEKLKSLGKLESWLKGKNQKLRFATNAGMYTKDRSPLGLFISEGKTLQALNTAKGKDNFYMEPNGVFYLTRTNEAFVCTTGDFKNSTSIQYATQSGPMLVITGKIHPRFIEGSKNLNVRNGVGILPGGKVLFVMSVEKINFYDFALYFKEQGCQNALYLDGYVSRTYLPEKNCMQKDGNFGVMIGVTE